MHIFKYFRKKIHPAQWHNLRNVKPLSKVFGLDRGTPVDRYYIEKFLEQHRSHITGNVLEIAENTYSKKFSTPPAKFEILHVDSRNSATTIVGDLTQPDTLPENKIDCFICTQTFNFIYDFHEAIRGAYKVLKPGGTLLATLAGITQISRYDMERWGDFWRFTTKSAFQAFAKVFGKENIVVSSFGNVLAAVSLLEGISTEELTISELDVVDEDYQVVITIVATKKL